jgi:hypothetical protein
MPLPVGQPGDVHLQRSTIDDVTTSQDPQTATTDHASGHRRVLRYASIVGVSIIVLTLAFWWSPVIGVILTITALLALAGALIPGTTHHDPHSPVAIGATMSARGYDLATHARCQHARKRPIIGASEMRGHD